MAEPEAEGEVEPETEPEIEPEPEVPLPESESGSTEPEPYWPTAFIEYGPAWELHVYTFAGIFLLIAILTCASMVYYLKDRQSLKQGTLTFCLQCLLLLFTLLRSLSLLVNPYLTQDDVSEEVFTIIWSLAHPGLTASFSVLMLVFLDTTKMTLGPPVFQRLPVLLAFSACHFVVVTVSDVLCLTTSACKPMLLFCQLLFILYGTVLSIGYLYVAIVLYRKCINGVVQASENKKIIRLVKISTVASIVAFSVSVTHVYAASSEFGIYSDVTYVEAWDWWILQSVMRLEEVASCCVILLIALRNPCGETRLSQMVVKLFSRKTAPVDFSDRTKNQMTVQTISSNVDSKEKMENKP